MKSIVDIGETCDLIFRPVVAVDSKGVLSYINNTAEKYFTTTNEFACGKDYSEIIKIMDNTGLCKLDLFENSNKAMECGEGILFIGGVVEYYIAFKSEEYVSSDTSQRYWIFIFEDITKEVELKQQLIHKRRLEVLGDLSVGIAHEINNTLGSIVGCSEILSMELGANERLEKLTNSIIESANNAAGLSQKLLRFSVSSDATSEWINIHDFLRETIGVLKSSIDKRITIKSNFVDEDIVVCAYRAELEIALLNIALNAQDAMSDGGVFSFNTEIINNLSRELKVDGFELTANYYLKIALIDNGEGIREDLLEKIFDPSYTTKIENDGEGHGLATVQHIMNHHKGAVEVMSTLGVRSQFNLFLPIAKDAHMDSPEEDSVTGDLFGGFDENALLDKKVVLLVDDNDMVRLSMHEVLESMDCQVIEAVNGEEGVRFFKENLDIIDLVILDVIMPVMDGKEAIEEMRRINTSIPVVIASGYMNQLSQSVFMDLGASGYLSKPFRVDELRSTVKSLCCVNNENSESDINSEDLDDSNVDAIDESVLNMKVVRDSNIDVIDLLLIEDNENIRELMQGILRDAGFNVTAFEDIENAKKSVAEGKYFSLSIINIDFTDDHDSEIFTLLKNTDDNRPRYIIASSGKDVEGVARRALKLGVDDFLVKPFSLNFMKIRLEVAKKYLENEQLKNKMQAMLKENQERMSLAIEGAGIGMWDWKINEKEFYASDRCKEIFGYKEGSKVGVLDYLNSITFKEDQIKVTKEFSNYLREQVGILNVEFRIKHSEKGDIWISSIAKIFQDKEGGKPKRLIGISMDITERKAEENFLREESQRLEEMVLQRTKELIKSNDELSKEIEAREVAELKNIEHQLKLMDADKLASLGILVAGIGHEINNPIQFIMFNLPFVKNAWESVLPILDNYYKEHPDFELRGIPYELARDRLPNMANDIMEGAERICSIVKELREYSRQSRDEDFQEEDIVEVVLSAKSLFSKFMGKSINDIGLHTPSEHVMASINRTRIEQVIINLLQNASLSLADSTKKEISIDLRYSDNKSMIEIVVSDTGVGVKKEHMKHLTDPFFTTRSGDGGTGLGLAMCKRIVHDHSGDIVFQSEEGVGTTVIVTLPVRTGLNSSQ